MSGHDRLDHRPAHEAGESSWAGRGAVLLDIGGDVGALVVEMPVEMTGHEVEIAPLHDLGRAPAKRAHVAVVARPAGARAVPSLVYPELVSGTYALCDKGTDVVRLTVRVEGGRVTQARWPAATREGDGEAPSGGPGAVA